MQKLLSWGCHERAVAVVPVYSGITSLAEIITRLRLEEHHPQRVSSPQIHICALSVAQCVAHLFALLQLHLGKLSEPFSQADAYRGHNVQERILLIPITTIAHSSIFPLPS